ncbi:MAG: DUF4202 domain-containing protein [Hyphomicrobiales bacterium]|nr:DUF4202 domain-containing protein [Hyphomicrobiales bacterium]
MGDAMSRLGRVLAEIDTANAEDPNRVDIDGESRPAELVYGERMSEIQQQLYPDASDELAIATRAQHLKRWIMPRSDYPMDRKGYLRWRSELKRKHAELAGGIMEECGYSATQIDRVGALIRKEGLKRDPECQALEDIVCVVFLKYYFAQFAAKHDDEKLIRIVAKTWGKMSQKGHEAALALDLEPELSRLVSKALEAGA